MPRSPYRADYTVRSGLIVAPTCGVIVFGLTLWETGRFVGPMIAGIATAIAIACVWSYRGWRQRHV